MLWTDVQKELRQTVQAISQRETEMRMRTIRLLTRKLAEKDQGLLAYEISKACSNESEKAEFAGRVGIELFLAGKREQAEQVLNKASTESPQSAAPALTALWLALNPDQNAPPATFPRVKPPEKGSSLTRDARLAYSEGKALQGKIVEGKQMAESPPESPIVFVMEADILVARVALETGKAAEAIPIVDSLARLVKENFKPEQTEKQPDWQLYQLVELAMKANRPDVAATVLDLMKEKTVASWARLEALRIKLASQPKEKGDETYLAAIGAPEDISLAAAISQEALARHNEAAGKTYRKAIEELPKVTVRPFAYAGLALGGQDRAGK
jgi:tetratricopeptide (TPR) repeat protein